MRIRYPHIILLGNQDGATCIALIKELYHPDRMDEAEDLELVIMYPYVNEAMEQTTVGERGADDVRPDEEQRSGPGPPPRPCGRLSSGPHGRGGGSGAGYHVSIRQQTHKTDDGRGTRGGKGGADPRSDDSWFPQGEPRIEDPRHYGVPENIGHSRSPASITECRKISGTPVPPPALRSAGKYLPVRDMDIFSSPENYSRVVQLFFIPSCSILDISINPTGLPPAACSNLPLPPQAFLQRRENLPLLQKIFLLVGDALVAQDRARIGANAAHAFIIVPDMNTNEPEKEDRENIVRVLALRKYHSHVRCRSILVLALRKYHTFLCCM